MLQAESPDFWVKVVAMLQQNWAAIETCPRATTVWFVDDRSGVFDPREFADVSAARAALTRNGFRRFSDDARLQSMMVPPRPPFTKRSHPNGPTYSSGRYWR